MAAQFDDPKKRGKKPAIEKGLLDKTPLRPISKGGVLPGPMENTTEGIQDRAIKTLGSLFHKTKPGEAGYGPIVPGDRGFEDALRPPSKLPVYDTWRPDSNDRYRGTAHFARKVVDPQMLPVPKRPGIFPSNIGPSPGDDPVTAFLGTNGAATGPRAIERGGRTLLTNLPGEVLNQRMTGMLTPRGSRKDFGKNAVAAIDQIIARQNLGSSSLPFGDPSAQVGAVSSTPGVVGRFGTVGVSPNGTPAYKAENRVISQQALNDLGAAMASSRIQRANQDFEDRIAEGYDPALAKTLARKKADVLRGALGKGALKDIEKIEAQFAEDKKENRKYADLKEERALKSKEAKADRDLLSKKYQDELGLSKAKADQLAIATMSDLFGKKTERMKTESDINNASTAEERMKLAAIQAFFKDPLAPIEQKLALMAQLGIPALESNIPE